ncbi:MAG: acyltransferase [Betaproteobacteria bacterium]|nr:acyltransferase [Candidatus Dechloromonas phosphorivorans]
MRKISIWQVAVFAVLLTITITAGIISSLTLASMMPLGKYHEIVVVFNALLLIYLFALIVFRLFLAAFPLRVGEIPENSQQEFIYHVYLLFYLILFYPILRSGFVPVPIMRLLYLGLGAKLGDNTYSSGIILDAQFVEIGTNSIVGQYALLVPHVIEGKKLAHYPIVMGNNVTIGAGATVLSGVTIGDGAIVSTGAVVTKGSNIGPGEIWGGVPAKRIGSTLQSPPLSP